MSRGKPVSLAGPRDAGLPLWCAALLCRTGRFRRPARSAGRAAGHSADEAVRIATSLWSADVTRKRRCRTMPRMLWPRLGGFDEVPGSGTAVMLKVP